MGTILKITSAGNATRHALCVRDHLTHNALNAKITSFCKKLLNAYLAALLDRSEIIKTIFAYLVTLNAFLALF